MCQVQRLGSYLSVQSPGVENPRVDVGVLAESPNAERCMEACLLYLDPGLPSSLRGVLFPDEVVGAQSVYTIRGCKHWALHSLSLDLPSWVRSTWEHTLWGIRGAPDRKTVSRSSTGRQTSLRVSPLPQLKTPLNQQKQEAKQIRLSSFTSNTKGRPYAGAGFSQS